MAQWMQLVQGAQIGVICARALDWATQFPSREVSHGDLGASEFLSVGADRCWRGSATA
jgi:hypothetical protein